MATNPTNVLGNIPLYRGLIIAGIALAVIQFVLVFIFLGQTALDESIDIGQVLAIFACCYLALSLKQVATDEVGATFFYGKALKKSESGLHFVPLLLMQIKKGPRTVQEFQCPGEPEEVQKTSDDVPLDEGKVRPIRVVTGGQNNNCTDTILNTRMTITVSFFVQWAVTDIFDYISNYGSNKIVEMQVRDIGEAVLAEIAVEHSPASFIDNLLQINKRLLSQVKTRFKNSGVKIISTRLISPDVSHEVSTALAGIPKARAEAEQMSLKADGEKAQIQKQGEGRAFAELALLKAQAEGRKKMMNSLAVDGSAILASEAVRGITDTTDVLVVGAEGGMKDVMGLVKGAQSALTIKGASVP